MGEKPEALDAVLKEIVDLRIFHVFEGLTNEAAEERLAIFELNKLEEKKGEQTLQVFGVYVEPTFMGHGSSAIMAIALGNGGENNAGNATSALMASFAPKAKVLRNGRWNEKEASVLVPGDIISIKLGDIVPADSCLLDGPFRYNGHWFTSFGTTAIEEMAGMDVLCGDKTGALTLNKLTVDKNLIEVFTKGIDADTVVLMAARASRTENQDAIDTAIVGMLADPKEFLPFNPTDKRTALTYIDGEGKWHRVSKGALDQGSSRRNERESRRPLAVYLSNALFDPPRHDSAETTRRALNLGVNVKMITGDQLAIGKETGRRLGMGTNMYPSSALLGKNKDELIAALPIDELIKKADGFAGIFPEHKYEIVKRLQALKHICGMTGDGVNDAPALKKAEIVVPLTLFLLNLASVLLLVLF
ncbi:hypothetical protein CASFOL_016205 [Castilleja foliolosa]|uniref:P-type ATPase A domain-containing protein n=1 Tax=Castilleja foliolosa TaxID=1961234 RepID=A0ABD3DJL5_9LAMI